MGKGYVYVIVRTDIPISDQIVQIGHACQKAGWAFEEEGQSMIVTVVPNQQDLLEAVGRAIVHGVKMAVFYEEDRELGACAACSQAVADDKRWIFKNYKLWSE